MSLLSSTLFAGFLMVVFYVIPAGSIHLMVWGLGDPKRERWEVTQGAHEWKTRYRQGAFFGQYLNLSLLGLFFVYAMGALILERFGCQADMNHLTGAAWNIVVIVERVWFIGWLVLVVGAALALVWSIAYYVKARKENWEDPRRRDAMLVHVFIVPLALLLVFVAFGATLTAFCPALS